MIVPHFRDSNLDVVDAASAAIDLLKNNGVVAIVGPQKSTQAEFVIDFGNKVKVPIISPATSPSLSPQQSPYFIRSSWSSASQARAVASIVKNFGWRQVVLVYEDNNYGNGLLPFLTENLLESNAFVSNMTAIPPSAQNDDDQILQHLHELNNMQTRVFVVHMLPPLASRFFKMARRARMMKEGYAWIITDALTSLLDSVDSKTIEAMQGVVGTKAYIPPSSELSNFTRRWKKKFYEENSKTERFEGNTFGLWTYDSIAALAEAVERVGVTSPNFKRRAKSGNVTDLEAIGTSDTGPSLARFLRNFTSKGLSGDFKISNGELQPFAFEIMNVVGRGGNKVGFWREDYGISKSLKGNDAKRSLGAVVWPGQTSLVPKGWGMNTNKKLRVGVPLTGIADGLIHVKWDTETNRVNATGFCIDVFEEVMSSMQYPVEYEYVPFQNADANSIGFHSDRLIQQVFLKNFDVVVAGINISAERSKYVDFTIPYIESGVSTVVPIPIADNKNTWFFMKPLTTSLWLTIGAHFIFTGFVVWALEHRENEEFRGPPLQQVGMIFWFSFSTLFFAHREKVKSNLSRFVVIIWLFVVFVLTTSYTASLTSMLTVQQLDPKESGFGFAFQKGSPLAPDVSRAILQLKENGKMGDISKKWFGDENCGRRNGTADAPKSLSLDNFKGLFLISGISSLSALTISLIIFFYNNRRLLTTRASIKRKLSDLAGAFDRPRVEKSLSMESTSSSAEKVIGPATATATATAITILCDEEEMFSPKPEPEPELELVVSCNCNYYFM